MLVMTSQPPKPSEAERRAFLKKLDRATEAHEKTRKALDGLVADARGAGLSLTDISDHTPYSREWVRRIAAQIQAERSDGARGEE
ncbi:hypothetical protein [Streptomyces incanus]|uniref:Transposase n=1 Tax=Streptomyces incanus TaxID=887453 RepID=A0ABW0XJU2_9ACTN